MHIVDTRGQEILFIGPIAPESANRVVRIADFLVIQHNLYGLSKGPSYEGEGPPSPPFTPTYPKGRIIIIHTTISLFCAVTGARTRLGTTTRQ